MVRLDVEQVVLMTSHLDLLHQIQGHQDSSSSSSGPVSSTSEVCAADWAETSAPDLMEESQCLLSSSYSARRHHDPLLQDLSLCHSDLDHDPIENRLDSEIFLEVEVTHHPCF